MKFNFYQNGGARRFAVLAAVFVWAFLAAQSCSKADVPKKLVITNIAGISGYFTIQLAGDTTGNNADAESMGTIQEKICI